MDVNHPLKSTINFSVAPCLQSLIEARLKAYGALGRRKLCLSGRTGYSSTGKNWGYLWREEMPEGKRREREECTDFMRLMLKKDPDFLFLIIEDRLYGGDDTVKCAELNAFS